MGDRSDVRKGLPVGLESVGLAVVISAKREARASDWRAFEDDVGSHFHGSTNSSLVMRSRPITGWVSALDSALHFDGNAIQHAGRTKMLDEPSVNQRIAVRVRQLRTARDMSLDALAERSGVSRSMISLIERGETSATAVLLEKLAAGL